MARAGDVAGAIMAGEAVLATGERDPGLAFFLGVLCCKQGDPARGVTHLRSAVAFAPAEVAPRVELARALIASGDEAGSIAIAAPLATPSTAIGREMQRIQAHGLLHNGDGEGARALYQAIVDVDAADFESWDGLGLSLLAAGKAREALQPLREAVRLRPAGAGFWINLSRAYARTEQWSEALSAAEQAIVHGRRHAEALLAAARAEAGLGREDKARMTLDEAVALGADNAEAWCEAAEIESQMKALDRAEAHFRTALSLTPTLPRALIGLGNVLERTNRYEALASHIDEAIRLGVPSDAMGLLRARLLRKAGQPEAALAAARQASALGDEAARAQLVGQIADGIGDSGGAFTAFAEANRLIAEESRGLEREADANLAAYRNMRALLTPAWLQTWPPPRAVQDADPRDPLFIFGFPRSGTTLIDTMLTGHPSVSVLEEVGIIQGLAEAVGSVERVPALTDAQVEMLRTRYFAEAARRAPGSVAGRLIVDKEPLGLASTLLLIRLFPNARFVFAERHPCDVVLSCFMTSRRMNNRVASFFDLKGTARFYDQVLAFWQQCARMLPITLHNVRYERLIVDTERELRRLATFAGLSWQPQLLASDANARKRVYIGSPSYAQVAEPIHTRAAGRWTRYRDQLEPVMPILRPWLERLGYTD